MKTRRAPVSALLVFMLILCKATAGGEECQKG